MNLPGIEGVNPGHAAAGFGGALAAIPFMPPSSPVAIIILVLSGLMTAMFLTPVTAEIISSPKLMGVVLSPRAELGLGFILGLTSMALVPMILGVVRWFGANLDALLRRFTGISKDQGEKP